MTDIDKTLPAGGPVIVVRIAGQSGPRRFVRSCSIGRSPDNDLALVEPSVSQRHAEIVYEDGRWWVRDLGSTNGTVVSGERIESREIEGVLRIRLGYQGPSLVLAPEGAAEDDKFTETAVPSDSAVVRRVFERSVHEVGAQTAALRRAFKRVQRRKARKYVVALTVVGLIGAGSASYAYILQQKFAEQQGAAEELFYAAKALELQVAELELSRAERQSLRQRRQELDQQYRDYIEELGIYGEETPREVRLVYRVVHRLGESEVNVPQEFVDEVLRYVESWKTTLRLSEAMARAHEMGYGQRIADIFLEHDLPPEFFYLAVQESDLQLDAVGPATRFGIAKGMWQFVPGTAREYGLKIGPLVGVGRFDSLDDRHDFEKATRAAAKYLRRIYTTDAQASGLLVIASYNWGQTRVLRLIRGMPPSPRQRNFWQLLTQHGDSIPQETYNYVFHIVSAAVIGEDPELFGFDFAPPFARPEPTESFDEVVADSP